MLKYSLKELDKLESLFIEIIDYPLKKEVLLYPICYCQLVRKTNSFEIELSKLINCANKTFRAVRGSWQDILAELNMFQVYTIDGNIYTGKDILKLADTESLYITLLQEYKENFNTFCSKLLKYWNILSRISTYGKRNMIVESIYITSLAFNEKLYEEVQLYINLNEEYFEKTSSFFRAIYYISEVFKEMECNICTEESVRKLEKALKHLEDIQEVFYGINIAKLRKDTEKFIKDLQKRKNPEMFTIEFVKGKDRNGSIFKKIINVITGKLKGPKPFGNINLIVQKDYDLLCKGNL